MPYSKYLERESTVLSKLAGYLETEYPCRLRVLYLNYHDK